MTSDNHLTATRVSSIADLEFQIRRIWQELLQVAVVTADDDFFTLGGDSMLALELTMHVEERFGCTIPLEFFDQPTVSHLVRLLLDEAPEIFRA
jgi:phthiocerol/phenolphthiocerol synthesis type-I polyketide synthase E